MERSASSPEALGIREIIETMEIVRMRFFMPDTSAYVRYLPRFEKDPEELSVNLDAGIERHVSEDQTGTFKIPELVNELEFAYILIHLFASRDARDFFLVGFDTALSQLDFIGGSYDFNRLWITKGTSNIGLPIAIFLGQRNAVNAQPSVSVIDHRFDKKGTRVYRAIRGSGTHVGEEFFEPQGES